MLVAKEPDRISWPDLFAHQLIAYDHAEIDKHIKQIALSETDLLLRSFKITDYYFKKNKVMGQAKNISSQSIKEASSSEDDSS